MNPVVSVVVPTYRRNDLLTRCLSALIVQDHEADRYEVIVVDDAADAATRSLVERWRERLKVTIRYEATSGKRGPAAARNIGWRVARGEIIAFTDDDCVPDRAWLQAGEDAIRAGADAVSGRLLMPLPAPPTDYQRDAAGLCTAEFVTANCFFRRSTLERLGGFDERFTAAWREDSDLFFSLLENKGKFERADNAVVVHPVRPAPWGISLSQQKKNLFNALLYKKHPDLYVSRLQPRPPWHYYASVLSFLIAASAFAAGEIALGCLLLGIWFLITLRFCLYRLRDTSRSPSHVAEMAVTSALIPPLAVYWRLRGAIRYRVLFL
jgi:glycosyltransferase involved in cell wall biosynthesis